MGQDAPLLQGGSDDYTLLDCRLRSRVAGFQFEVVRRVDGKPVQWKVCDEAELGRIIQREKELKVTCPWRKGYWDIPTADECKFMTTLQDRWNLIRSHLGCAYNVLGVKLPDEALFHQYMEHNEWELAWDELRSVADSKPSWGHKINENEGEFWQEMALAARNMIEK